MIASTSIRSRLEQTAVEAGKLRQQARDMLIEVVADAHQVGMTQREIARHLGRSQPEVSRLLSLASPRFMPTSPLGHHLISKRAEIYECVEAAGASNIRVFGSLARGEDSLESDIDLLIDMPEDFTLMTLAAVQISIGRILECSVDVVPASGLKGKIKSSALDDAVAL